MFEKIEQELSASDGKELFDILKFVLWVKFRKRMNDRFYPPPPSAHWVKRARPHWIR
jgi:hypothetical protein